MIPEEKKVYLREHGLSDDQIAVIEAGLGEKAKDAKDAKLEFKETEEVVEEAVTEEPEQEVTPTEDPQPVTREEVAEAITEVVEPLAKAILELSKSDEEKIAEKAEEVPAASIAAIIARNLRAVGSDDAKLEKGERVTGPKQEKDVKEKTGIGFIDTMLAKEEK